MNDRLPRAANTAATTHCAGVGSGVAGRFDPHAGLDTLAGLLRTAGRTGEAPP